MAKAGGKAGKTKKAGLKLPVSRIHHRLTTRTTGPGRVGTLAGVFTAAVLEYLVVDVLMHAGIAAKNMNQKRITPRHILLAVCGDKDLHSLIENVGGSGLIPLA